MWSSEDRSSLLHFLFLPFWLLNVIEFWIKRGEQAKKTKEDVLKMKWQFSGEQGRNK